MKKMKVMTIVGTRPEIIRLSRVLPKLDQMFDHTLAHTGQNYDHELNQIFFSDLALRNPDHNLNTAGTNSAQTIGNVILSIDKLLEQEMPDAVLILGDTNSCLSAIPAKRRRIPIFHMEAGNRCFDMRVPEEINRKIIDHISDINLPYSSIARDYLLQEGFPPSQIITTGSPMLEVLTFYRDQIDSSCILENLNLVENNFFLISLHREENVDSKMQFQSWVKAVNAIASTYRLPIIVSTHPRTQKQIDINKPDFSPLVRLIKPLGFFDYNKLQMSAKAVLSDSGTITEESSILNFPALNIREAHERPEGMEEASVMMVGLDSERILQALLILESEATNGVNSTRTPSDYQSHNVSEKIVKIIMSYTDYVNRVVWRK